MITGQSALLHINCVFSSPPSECTSDEDGLGATLEAIACLPPPNKDTLAFLILHLQRVAAQHQANKMPMVSLAKVFGPTIVGESHQQIIMSVVFSCTQLLVL